MVDEVDSYFDEGTTTMSNKISMSRIKEIIQEELESLHEKKARDHEGVKKVVIAASALLKAVDAWEKKATEAQKSGVSEQIASLKITLETMIDGPSAYVDVTPGGPKRVIFSKPSKGDVVTDSKK